jgi:hypothetical protein
VPGKRCKELSGAADAEYDRAEAQAKLDGKKQHPGPSLRQGTTFDTDGKLMKIIRLLVCARP